LTLLQQLLANIESRQHRSVFYLQNTVFLVGDAGLEPATSAV
jgi:hypothetical protein